VKNNVAHITTGKKKALDNPIAKIVADKKETAKAIKDKKPLSKLKDIKFVNPI
jgi:hypothetical protein